jgi:hypothetical protein
VRATVYDVRSDIAKIIGTFEGADEAEVLEKAARDRGFAGYADRNAKLNLTRDNYRVKEV